MYWAHYTYWAVTELLLICSQEEEEEEPEKEENSNTGFATVTFESEPGMVIFGEVDTASKPCPPFW